MNNMMNSKTLLLYLFFIIFFLNSQLLKVVSFINVQTFDDYNGDEKENQIRKVSGVDESEEKRDLVIEKFRILLGLKNFNSLNGHIENGFLSPSPSPNGEAAAPTPAPVPVPAPAPLAHHHSHSHFPPQSILPLLQHGERKEDQEKARVRRIVIAVAVSSGAVIFLSGLGMFLFCWKFGRSRRRSAKTMSISGSSRGSKYISSANSTSKNVETVSISWRRKDEMGIESGKDSRKSCSDNASCGSVEEVLSVREIRETVKCVTYNGDRSSGDEIGPVETLSSDDESFHSLCDSHVSNVRNSSASEKDLVDTIEFFSPPQNQIESPQPLPPPPPPPTPPPPPPPPSPSLHFLPSRSSSRPHLPAKHNVASRANSDSSLGSNDSSSTHYKLITGSRDPPGSATDTPPPPSPPPPLFAKGSSNPLRPPPPPPSPQFTPAAKDGSPLPKLKPLHWDKVRATPDRSMVWDKLKCNSFEFDEKMIESLFGYKLQNGSKNDEAKSKTPSPSKHILEPKRLQNITILLKALNATAEEVCDALTQGNGLCLQQLESLIKAVPTKEEQTLLLSYQGNINELGSAEMFVRAILGVPFAFLRIEAMLYRDTFEDEVVHLRKSFAMLEEACKELRSSRLFLKLLEAVLKTGNRMNVGTIRGGARAFKLDALLKLADVKGTDGKTTLLHFVVQEMIRSEGIREFDIITTKNNNEMKGKTDEEREEDYKRMGLDHVSSLTVELCNVKKTATIDLDVLASSVSNLSDGMIKLHHLVHEDLSVDDQNGNFSHSMRMFLTYAEKNIKELKKDEDNVLLHVREITEYFHGDVSKDEANPLRIFVIVRDFLGMLDQVCKEVRSLKLPKTPNSLAPFR